MGFSLLIFGLVLFWLFYPYKILVFNTPVFSVVTKTVKQGGTLKYISNYCKYVDMTARVNRVFVNDILYSTPEMTSSRETGCHIITIAVSIPRELPVGTYHLENLYEYQVNPIRKIIIEEHTENFTVTE